MILDRLRQVKDTYVTLSGMHLTESRDEERGHGGGIHLHIISIWMVYKVTRLDESSEICWRS